jgi:hypothetical protein
MKIENIDSYNAGICDSIKILRQQFFSGKAENFSDLIALLEKRIAQVPPQNGVFETIIPDSVDEIFVEQADLIEMA